MALYESKYGVITQPDESTYIVGNYQIVEVEDSGYWELSPVAMPTNKTWLTSSALFNSLDDAFRVAIVFGKEDSLALGIKDFINASVHRKNPDSIHLKNGGI
jgi:hypothetical protein